MIGKRFLTWRCFILWLLPFVSGMPGGPCAPSSALGIFVEAMDRAEQPAHYLSLSLVWLMEGETSEWKEQNHYRL